MDLKRAKKERSTLRTAFTKLHGKISSCLAESTIDDDVVGQLEVLREKQQRLSELDNQVLSALFEDDSQDDDVNSEVESADHYKALWHALWSKYQRLLNKEAHSSASSTNSAPNTMKSQPGKRQVKLPKIELIKFDGDIRNWISFWGQFSKIHDEVSLDEHDKFQYLLGAIPAGTPARSVIESFPPSAQNYRSAIDHLTQRFGREDLLIEVYTRDLLNLVLLQSKQDHAPSLSSLYDKLTTQLRALETLGLTNDKYAAMLYPLVESALPGDVLKAWERERRSRERGKPERGKALSGLLDFLKEEVESCQRIDLAKTGFVIENANSELTNVANKPQPTTSCFVAIEKVPNTKANDIGVCIWCKRQSHSSMLCYKATGLSLEQKKQHIKKVKACAHCLRVGHNAFKCRSPIKCPACFKRHNFLLCPELSKVSKTTKGAAETEDANNKESSMTVNLGHDTHRSNVTLLQTLLVKIIHKGQEIVVRALIDSGAQKSYIKRELAENIGLPVTGEEKIGHIVFGGIETKQTLHKVYDVIIANLDDTYRFSMKVLDEEKICGDLPRVYECDLLEKLWKCGVTLTDVGWHKPEVSLLIGADFCGMLLTSDIVQIDDGLTAIRTTLGWTVQGMKLSNVNSSILSTSLHVADLWDLETPGIMHPVETKCRRELEEEVQAKFESSIKTWRFVPGTMNPVDLPARDCDAKTLLQSVWWKGPRWLKLNEKDWCQNTVIDDKQADSVLRETSCVNFEVNKSDFSEDLLYFGKYLKIVRKFAWIRRFWRMVRSVKELLRRVLGRSVVTFVQLETVLCDCKAVINARPLTYVTESDVLAPITPNNFLQCIPRNDVPDLDLVNEKSLNQRIQYVQKLRQDLRQRFRSEYLSLLVQRGKERMQQLKVGDVVLIETQDKRVHWPLGLVVETFKGKDGHSRVARLRMAGGGELTRPYQRLYPLELQSQCDNPVVTRSGRIVRVPQRFLPAPGGC